MTARFAPGDGIAIIGGDLAGVVAADLPGDLLDELVQVPTRASNVFDELIRVLAARPLSGLPSFAFIVSGADGAHVLVRGTAKVSIDGRDFEAPFARSWSEFLVPLSGAMVLSIGAEPHAPARFWCDAGVIPASALVVEAAHFTPRATGAAGPSVEAAAAPAPVEAAPIESTPVEAGPAEVTPAQAAPVEAIVADEPEATAQVPDDDEPITEVVPEPAGTRADSIDITEPEPQPQPLDDAAIGAESPSNAGALETDDDVTPRVPITGVPITGVPVAPSGDADITSNEIAPFPAAPAAATATETRQPEPGVAANGDDDFGDHDGLTITIPTVPTPAPADEAIAAPTVEAVHCPNAHPNPPAAAFCRICGMAIADRTVSRIARPLLGNLTVRGTSTNFPVDRPMILGRRPSAASERDVNGEPARLVPLPDPEQVLSKVHAEIRIDQWQVSVVDRDSRNHTFVTLPGESPQQLEPGTPTRIVPGTTIDLAGTLALEFETGTR